MDYSFDRNPFFTLNRDGVSTSGIGNGSIRTFLNNNILEFPWF
jgi:hypothetical protein